MARSEERLGKKVVKELKDELRQLNLQIRKLRRSIHLFDTHEFTPGADLARQAARRAVRKARRK